MLLSLILSYSIPNMWTAALTLLVVFIPQNLETLRALIQDFLNCLNPNGTVDTRAIASDILDFELKLASVSTYVVTLPTI